MTLLWHIGLLFLLLVYSLIHSLGVNCINVYTMHIPHVLYFVIMDSLNQSYNLCVVQVNVPICMPVCFINFGHLWCSLVYYCIHWIQYTSIWHCSYENYICKNPTLLLMYATAFFSHLFRYCLLLDFYYWQQWMGSSMRQTVTSY